jgi:hypothetical protein
VEDTIRVLIGLGFGLLLVMLRLDAERFGAAEFAEPALRWSLRGLWRRASWYVVGLALIVAVGLVHPSPGDLLLRLGDRGNVVMLGLVFVGLGSLQAFAAALILYRRLRLPAPWAYPIVLLNSTLTALIDEAAFRGILLAYLLGSGMGDVQAIVIQGFVYALSTRLGAPGRPFYLFLVFLVVGLVAGWSVIVTGGIGAAIIGHAATRFVVFISHGYAGDAGASEGDATEGNGSATAPDRSASPPGEGDSVTA